MIVLCLLRRTSPGAGEVPGLALVRAAPGEPRRRGALGLRPARCHGASAQLLG